VASSLDYHATIDETKRELIIRAFERAENSHAAAARLLGVHPNYLHRLLRNFNLRGATSGGTSGGPSRT
jgi:transcriptional regulator with GAF, ATPase, and Fis domain